MAYLNRAKAYSSTTGTGSITAGLAVIPFQTWSAAGAVNGTTYPYLIEDGVDWEVGTGVYTSGVITRPGPGTDDTFESSTGSLLSLTGSATVAQVAIKESYSGGGGTPLFDISMGVPPMSGLTQYGSSSYFGWTENPGIALNVKNHTSTSGISIGGFLDTAWPSGDFHYTWLILNNQARRRFFGPAIGIRDSASGRVQAFSYLSHASGGAGTISFMNFNSPTSRSSVVTETGEFIGFPVPWYWAHMKRTGTSIQYGWSTDGANPLFPYNYSETSWTASPDQIFFGCFCESTDFFANQNWTLLCYDKNADARVMGG